MVQLSYRRHRFPAEIIRHAIWLYLRFTLSYRDVEELLAERGLDVSYETVRRWVLKFGPLIARKLRRGRPRPSARWHLDEMVVRIAGKRMYLWRAVDHVAAAIRLVNNGHAAAIVACPHSETSVNAAGIPFSGYPSLLARLMNVPEDEVFLMLVGGGLLIVHVTLHERLHTALGRITSELIERATRTADAALRKLKIEQPRIGLFGINPHAGEGGLFGDDDERITVPAAKRLQALGLNVEGPTGADLMLGRCDFDAFVAMYHDQGHIPVKLLAGRNSAALSIGSGLLFSSVGHGSAFDIAGRGIAKPEAVLRSIQLLDGASYFEDVAAL